MTLMKAEMMLIVVLQKQLGTQKLLQLTLIVKMTLLVELIAMTQTKHFDNSK